MLFLRRIPFLASRDIFFTFDSKWCESLILPVYIRFVAWIQSMWLYVKCDITFLETSKSKNHVVFARIFMKVHLILTKLSSHWLRHNLISPMFSTKTDKPTSINLNCYQFGILFQGFQCLSLHSMEIKKQTNSLARGILGYEENEQKSWWLMLYQLLHVGQNPFLTITAFWCDSLSFIPNSK